MQRKVKIIKIEVERSEVKRGQSELNRLKKYVRNCSKLLTALKKQSALVSAVMAMTTMKKNLNPPSLLCVLILTESVSSESSVWRVPAAGASAGMVTATLGGPSKSFKKA